MVIVVYTDEIFVDLDVEDVKPNTYKISNYGRILNIKRGTFVKPQTSNCGYLRLELSSTNKDGARRYSVHRLVALTFIHNDDPTNKTQVNHIDGDKQNNFEGNLEWVTPKENLRHAVQEKMHWQYVGEKHPNSKLSNDFVLFIDRLLQLGYNNKMIINVIRNKYPAYNRLSDKCLIRYIGRIKRRDRYGKILNNKSSTTIERNID